MDKRKLIENQILSENGKNANGKKWYKEKIDLLDTNSYRDYVGSDFLSERERMQLNYDLFNNIISMSDLDRLCSDGVEIGDLPADFTNKDILSNKIKVLLGLESSMPFEYTVVAVNPEATTRKEEKENELIKEYVINSIMAPIIEQIEMNAAMQAQGRELTEQEVQQLQQQIAEETEAMTPPRVKAFMQREHKDPAEMQAIQLLNYLMKKKKIKEKFNKGAKNAALVAREFYWVGEVNGDPDVFVLNPKYFTHDTSPNLEGVQFGEFATYEHYWSPSKIATFFAGELSAKELKEIYSHNIFGGRSTRGMPGAEIPPDEYQFNFSNKEPNFYDNEENTIRVLQCEWKALTEIYFLTYFDMEDEQEKVMLVSENYDLNPEIGDIKLEKIQLPQVYEGWKIGKNIYKRMKPVSGQFKDIDNIYDCRLRFIGDLYDADNSRPTSIFDRGVNFQKYYNMIYFRLEMLMASDKGKKVLMNINAIPDSLGIDVDKFNYFFETSPFTYYNPNEEGMQYADVNTIAKVIDLSTASDMAKYMDIGQRIKEDTGEAMGISRQMEAQMQNREAVQNVQQSIQQSSLILASFFNLHSNICIDVIDSLLNVAKVIYRNKPKQYLYNVLDDMSVEKFMLDPEMLDNSSYGLFVVNAQRNMEIKAQLSQLSFAAIQSQKATLADAIAILREESLQQAEEKLRMAEVEAEERQNKIQREQMENQKEIEQIISDRERQAHEDEKEIVVLKEEERRKTVIAQAALTGASFNPELDRDGDGENDFVEIARDGLDANIKASSLQLEREKFEHQKLVDAKNIEISEKEAQAKIAKSAQKPKT